jgi:hypothetical protein
MATTSEHGLAELKRELAELAKQAERLAGWAREISDRLERRWQQELTALLPSWPVADYDVGGNRYFDRPVFNRCA